MPPMYSTCAYMSALSLETAVDRFMALKNLMHKHGDDPL